MLRRAELFLGDSVDSVSFDAMNPGGSKPVEDLALDLTGQLSAQLIDRPPQAAAHRDGPEILRRAKCLVTIFSSNIDTLGAAIMEERADRLRCRVIRSQGLKAAYRSGRTRRTASNQISYAGLQNRAPHVVIASRPPGRTMRHSSATCVSISGTKKMANTHTTASK